MKRFLITSHVVFALVGVANTMLGPLLPVLAQRWQLADRQSGLLFFVQFACGFAGAITSTRLAKYFSLHLIARAGLLCVAVGFLGLAMPSLVVATLGLALNGIGLGLANPTITASVCEAAPDRRAAILNLLNFVWALGAITAPNLVVAAMRHGEVKIPQMLIGYALLMAMSAFIIPQVATSSFVQPSSGAKLSRSMLRLIIACGVLIFTYVGIENGIAGWLPTFAIRVQGFTLQRTALLQDTFWMTFLAGRFLAPVFLRFTGERLLLTLSMCVAALGTIALLLFHSPLDLFISVATVGLGCAAVFPTAIAVLSHHLGGQSGSNLGFVFASAGLGAGVLPYCIGWLSSASQSLRTAMWLLVGAEVVLLFAHAVMSNLAARGPDISALSNQA